MMGVQFAKASGLTVHATCSPHNFDELRMLGADSVFSYKSPECAAAIKKATGNKLAYAWDCIGDGSELCAAALGDTEPVHLASVDLFDDARLRQVNPSIRELHTTLAYDAFGEKYEWHGELVEPKPDELSFATAFWELAEKLLASGVVRPVKTAVNFTGSGLDGALKGIDELRRGNVSGAKLVYTI